MDRPRLLLVSWFTELMWVIEPALEEWAEVATYDPMDISEGDVAFTHEALAARGLAEWDRRGWESCFVVGDGWGTSIAIRIAASRPGRVLGLALGHATLSQRRTGERAPISDSVWSAMTDLLRTDSEAFITNAVTQLTGGAYDEELTRRSLARYSGDDLEAVWRELTRSDLELGETLAELDLPLLLAKHEGCLLHSDEGYEDAVRAFPAARTVTTERACPTDPRFAEALRGFCESVLGAEQS